jgi:glycosyltransferase involved in cell wall biosynthesis
MTGTGRRHRPLISIVVATRDCAETIDRCFRSVVGQTYPHVELVVIDGGSTDGTVSIIERYETEIAYWETKPDRGIYDAWNKALDHVSGDWVLFLGADDQFAGAAALAGIEQAASEADPRIRVVYGELDTVARDGAVLRRDGEPWPNVRAAFRNGMSIPHSATLHRRQLFEIVGRFDESYRIAGDYELLLRELIDRDALFVPGVLVRKGAGGLSDRPDSRVLRLTEAERARRMHGLARGPVALAPAVIRARVREIFRRTLGPRAEATAHSMYRRLRGGRATR